MRLLLIKERLFLFRQFALSKSQNLFKKIRCIQICYLDNSVFSLQSLFQCLVSYLLLRTVAHNSFRWQLRCLIHIVYKVSHQSSDTFCGQFRVTDRNETSRKTKPYKRSLAIPQLSLNWAKYLLIINYLFDDVNRVRF